MATFQESINKMNDFLSDTQAEKQQGFTYPKVLKSKFFEYQKEFLTNQDKIDKLVSKIQAESFVTFNNDFSVVDYLAYLKLREKHLTDENKDNFSEKGFTYRLGKAGSVSIKIIQSEKLLIINDVSYEIQKGKNLTYEGILGSLKLNSKPNKFFLFTNKGKELLVFPATIKTDLSFVIGTPQMNLILHY